MLHVDAAGQSRRARDYLASSTVYHLFSGNPHRVLPKGRGKPHPCLKELHVVVVVAVSAPGYERESSWVI